MVFGLFKKKPVQEAPVKAEAPAMVAVEVSVAPKVDWAALGESPSDVPEPIAEEALVPKGSLAAPAPVQHVIVDAPKAVVAPEPAQPLNILSEALTAEDVVAAYKFFLGRLPENMAVVAPRVGLPPDRILLTFLLSQEFLARAEVQPVILEAARRILKAQNPESGSA